MTRVLSDFRIHRPANETAQADALEWIVRAHVESETRHGTAAADLASFAVRMKKLVARCACDPSRIGARGHVLADMNAIYDLARSPHGHGTGARSRLFETEVARYFEDAYPDDEAAPDDIVHVTCTGYVAPSGAQRLVARRNWGDRTRVTHAYHMGCYASIPALRIAEGCLRTSRRGARTDIVHTELCTLHLDPAEHSPEQIVVQSLFADGFIRYSMSEDVSDGLEILATHERIIPDSADAMRWVVSDYGMQMTLSREVPKLVHGVLREFVVALLSRADIGIGALREVRFAVHPGGPRIIDGVRDSLELDESQVRTSREVLFDYGNMSSATLPHVWKRMLDEVAPGTIIASLAFGPGLTVCGAVFRKR